MYSLAFLFDLIETLWNVKLTEMPALNLRPEDLIETLWNVKYSSGMKLVNATGFNRDIVECKVPDRTQVLSGCL